MTFRMQVWVAAGFLVLLTGLTIAAAVFSQGQQAGPGVAETTVPALSASDWTRGKADAQVSVTEYGDFQCPACAQYELIVKQLMAEYGDRILFGFRDFPLPGHPYAWIAAQAAEAAGLQGKYWEMHDLIYQKQTEWSGARNAAAARALFDGYAGSLGLDMARFASDIESVAIADEIGADLKTGQDAEVDHTPTFFVNNKQIANPQSYEQFKSIIDAALASSTAN